MRTTFMLENIIILMKMTVHTAVKRSLYAVPKRFSLGTRSYPQRNMIRKQSKFLNLEK